MTAERRGGGAEEIGRRAFLLTLGWYAGVSLAISLAAMVAFNWVARDTSLFVLANFVGPTAETLLHGKGLTVCSEGLGTLGNPICFHAARMPLPSAVIALGVGLVGDDYLRVGLFKLLLLLAPLELAAWIALERLPEVGLGGVGRRRAVGCVLLLLPFLITAFLADVVNLQVEEGYSYSLLALATALALFRPAGATSWRRTMLFAASVALLYLAKSSMAPAVVVLTIAFLWPVRRQTGRVAATLGVVLLAAAGWAMWQHHAAGRYTFGTSIDGVNLHKGNDEMFLAHYPPRGAETLDVYDPALNHGLYFPDEWSFNDYHQRAAAMFIRTHPRATLVGAWRKLAVVLFSVRKLGSRPGRGAMKLVEDGGMLLFRLLFWAALGLSVRALGREPRDGQRYAAGTFLLLVAAVALPYVVGFAYTRHISVLIYPAALMLCRFLAEPAADKALR